MLYRFRRALNVKKFDRAIAGVLDTKPLILSDAPWCIVSMVVDRDIPMYLVAIKSFYARIGRGKVVAIIDRNLPDARRALLSQHVPGIEFVILEDIPTTPCQRGGTWERLLYCLDRSETEYVIQLDADTLTVGDDLSDVIGCVEANRAFTMADGFTRVTVREAVRVAKATPGNYIGISSERALEHYPGADGLHYIRGSSGFAGFAKGGYTRAQISEFHQIMERLMGEVRWREWGSEQFGSNFAVANSPDPLVLPYPDYASFIPSVLRDQVKLFHFIGTYRFKEQYFARRSQEVIALLQQGAPARSQPRPARASLSEDLPFLFARNLVPSDMLRYLAWRASGRKQPITVQIRSRPEFLGKSASGPRLELRPPGGGNSDMGTAYEVFIHKLLMPPVWLPPERVTSIVDLGANVGMSCLWWLANYWGAQVEAYEPHPAHAAQARANAALNGFTPRLELHEAAVGTQAGTARLSDEGMTSNVLTPAVRGFEVPVVDLLAALAGRRVDILKMDIEGSEVALLDDPRFGKLDVGTIVLEWHTPDPAGRGGRDWCISRLEARGFRTYVTQDQGQFGMVWGYRDYGAPQPVRAKAQAVPVH